MTGPLHPAQLSLLEAALAGELCDRRRMPTGDGAPRLLRELVRRGLDPAALRAAAALALELDERNRGLL